MANGSTTYSFKDLTGAFISVLAGTLMLGGGKIGAGKVTVNMLTTKSEMDTALDGAVMTSAIVGDAGTLQIECQQTSAMHKFLLAAANLHFTAVENGDVSNFASSVVNLRNVVDGTEHLATGVSFVKIPPKAYDARGGMITWDLNGSNIINL